MIEIKDLLGRFDNLLVSGEFKKESIRRIISEIIAVEIESDKIKIKNGVVYLDIKPIYKNEILLKKEKIDSMLEQSMGKNVPRELR